MGISRAARRVFSRSSRSRRSRATRRDVIGRPRGVEKQVKALVVAHRGDVQLRADSLFLAADAARRGFLEVQNGGV